MAVCIQLFGHILHDKRRAFEIEPEDQANRLGFDGIDGFFLDLLAAPFASTIL
jgi:hypothetical protein